MTRHKTTYIIMDEGQLTRIKKGGTRGRCGRCGKPFKKGDEVSITRPSHRYSRTKHYHSSCKKELYL